MTTNATPVAALNSSTTSEDDHGIGGETNIPGIVAVVVFYIGILAVGILAARKTAKSSSKNALLIADRSIGLGVSILTFTATLVGGGYINGTSEKIAKSGLLQTPAPVGYCLSLVVAAFSYAPKMREEGYITMFDPFSLKWGKKVSALLFVVQLIGDLFWCAATLAALGATMVIILGIPFKLAVIISASVAVTYTFFGGLYAVAYTDVIQLGLIAFGLILAAPFSMSSDLVDMNRVKDTWLGEIPSYDWGAWIDKVLLCIFGGIPWQAFFQRALACKDVWTAKVSCLVGGIFALLLGIPPMIIGVAGSAASWNETRVGENLPWDDKERYRYMLPLGLQYLTPTVVSIIGIGAMAAAVMSSADSTVLSSSSVFAKNVYNDVFRPQCSDTEMRWVLRISIVVFGIMASLIAMFSTSIYGLYLLCSDLMYVILFPQLTIVLWVDSVNAYGSIVGFCVSFLLRVLAGEAVVGIPVILEYPGYDGTPGGRGQLFPHRTFAMLLGTSLMFLVSFITNKLFINEIVDRKYDVLQCWRQKTIKMRPSYMDGFVENEKKDNNDGVALTGSKPSC